MIVILLYTMMNVLSRQSCEVREMVKPNEEIRLFARGLDVPLWRVAAELSISEQTLIRRLRKELPVTEKDEMRKIVESVAKRGNLA